MTGTWIKSHPTLPYLNPDLLKSSHDKVEFRGQIQANIMPANVMLPPKNKFKKITLSLCKQMDYILTSNGSPFTKCPNQQC